MSAITSRIGDLFKALLPARSAEPGWRERPETPEEVPSLTLPAGAPLRRGLLSRLPIPARRTDAAIRELQRGYADALELMRSMRAHMDRQADYNERLLGLMERLPEALAALPETNRNQAKIVEALHAQMEQQGRQSRELSDTLKALARAGEHQTQALGAIHRQAESAREADRTRHESLMAMGQTMRTLTTSSEAGVQALRHLCDAARDSSTRMETLMKNNTRSVATLTVLTLASGLLAAGALGAAAYAILLIAGVA